MITKAPAAHPMHNNAAQVAAVLEDMSDGNVWVFGETDPLEGHPSLEAVSRLHIIAPARPGLNLRRPEGRTLQDAPQVRAGSLLRVSAVLLHDQYAMGVYWACLPPKVRATLDFTRATQAAAHMRTDDVFDGIHVPQKKTGVLYPFRRSDAGSLADQFFHAVQTEQEFLADPKCDARRYRDSAISFRTASPLGRTRDSFPIPGKG